MKRFFFWFFWLQVGMPFLVATGYMGCVSLGTSSWALFPLNGLACGLLGVVIYSPLLLINTTVVYLLMLCGGSGKNTRVILALDSLMALFLVGGIPVGAGFPWWVAALSYIAWIGITAWLVVKVPLWGPDNDPVSHG